MTAMSEVQAQSASRAATRQNEPSDEFLVASLRGGDQAALRKLMTRYDRLVRYTIFKTARDRSRQDADWLNGVAMDVWTQFASNIETVPRSVPAFLTTIAYRKAISALRAARVHEPVLSSQELGNAIETAAAMDAAVLQGQLEELDALRGCYGTLSAQELPMMAELDDILNRHWSKVAIRLGWSESTLRSRWSVTLKKLADCMEQKLGREFAPEELASDK